MLLRERVGVGSLRLPHYSAPPARSEYWLHLHKPSFQGVAGAHRSSADTYQILPPLLGSLAWILLSPSCSEPGASPSNPQVLSKETSFYSYPRDILLFVPLSESSMSPSLCPRKTLYFHCHKKGERGRRWCSTDQRLKCFCSPNSCSEPSAYSLWGSTDLNPFFAL